MLIFYSTLFVPKDVKCEHHHHQHIYAYMRLLIRKCFTMSKCVNIFKHACVQMFKLCRVVGCRVSIFKDAGERTTLSQKFRLLLIMRNSDSRIINEKLRY